MTMLQLPLWEEQLTSKTDLFIDVRDVLKEDKLINMVVSIRGTGKTTSAVIAALDLYRRTGLRTIWLRRYKKELKEAKTGFLGLVDTPDVQYFLPDFIIQNDKTGNVIDTKNKKTVVQFMALSTTGYDKSANFSDVGLIIFDEFIIKKGNVRYLGDECFIFNEFVYSVARFRNNLQVLLLGNHISNYNPYYTQFNVSVDDKTTEIKRKQFYFKFYDNKNFTTMAKKTKFAQAMEGTTYYNYAFDRQTALEERNIVMKKKGRCEVICNISHHFEMFTLYLSYDTHYLHLAHYSKNHAITIHTAPDEGTADSIFYRDETVSSLRDLLRYYMHNNLVYADTHEEAEALLNIIKIIS